MKAPAILLDQVVDMRCEDTEALPHNLLVFAASVGVEAMGTVVVDSHGQ